MNWNKFLTISIQFFSAGYRRETKVLKEVLAEPKNTVWQNKNAASSGCGDHLSAAGKNSRKSTNMKIYKYVNLQTYRYKNTVQKIRTHTMAGKGFFTQELVRRLLSQPNNGASISDYILQWFLFSAIWYLYWIVKTKRVVSLDSLSQPCVTLWLS